ncbi:hypothetical protein ALC57_08961 [Trachymyrmex cornetzi]|uniref:EF-hand domain-containing protein n=1 Tax=Trachymyrmex cornetzi TaxID=471704 RepID=A0A151J6J9_9HYME|nr:hypothetical protein ALC57_08961 [Trachymyrmex cornetzi]
MSQTADAESETGSICDEERVRKLFQACDGDGDGYIDSQDLLTVCRELNLENSVEELMRELGADEHGRISYQEFLRRRLALRPEIEALRAGKRRSSPHHTHTPEYLPTSSDNSLGTVSGRHESWEFDSGARDLSPEPHSLQKLVEAEKKLDLANKGLFSELFASSFVIVPDTSSAQYRNVFSLAQYRSKQQQHQQQQPPRYPMQMQMFAGHVPTLAAKETILEPPLRRDDLVYVHCASEDEEVAEDEEEESKGLTRSRSWLCCPNDRRPDKTVPIQVEANKDVQNAVSFPEMALDDVGEGKDAKPEKEKGESVFSDKSMCFNTVEA